MFKFFGATFTLGLSAFCLTACGNNTAPSLASATSNGISPTVPHILSAPVSESSPVKGRKVIRIYVAEYSGNGGTGSVEGFKPSGRLCCGSSAEMGNPQDLVVSNTGKLYVANFGRDNILEFVKQFRLLSEGITLADRPVGLALASNGKLYVSLYNDEHYPTGTIVTFNRKGQQINPTIMGTGAVRYVAVDAAGKIYVTNSATNTLNTYLPNGKPTTPTITAGLDGPGPVRVDASGKIYVANDTSNEITTYNSDGSQTTPTIAVNAPHGISIADNGNIYVTDSMDMTALVFNAKGVQIQPTITNLAAPTGIAVLNSR